MQTDDVIQMKMAQQKKDGLGCLIMLIQLVKAVSGIQNNIIIIRLNQNADGVAGG